MPNKGFEQALEELELLVEELDRGELGIEEAINKYESAMGAYRTCKGILSKARRKIEQLVRDAEGNIESVPFGTTEESPAE